MCNAVSHRLCIATRDQLLDGDSGTFNHVCLYCQAFLKEDTEYCEKMRNLTALRRRQFICGALIVQRIVVFLEKRRFKRKIAAIVLVQSVIRMKIGRMKYEAWKKSKLRLLLLEFTSLPPRILERGLVILTAQDSFSGTQLIRIDKKGECVLRESFLLPGVNAQMNLFLTLAVREEVAPTPQYLMIAQGQLSLRDLAGSHEKKLLTVNFVDKIKVSFNSYL